MTRPVLAAVVTGAGRGLGRTLVLELARLGYPLAIQARTQAELYDVRAAVEALGARCRVVVGDVTRPEAALELVERCEAELGPLGVAVAAAGRGLHRDLLKTSTAEWQEVLEANVTAPFHLLQAAAAAMQSRRIRGRIVVVAGVSALRGLSEGAAFSASKHALLGLVRSAALELAPQGITVNALCPGLLRGQTLEEAAWRLMERSGCTHEQALGLVLARTPMGEAPDPGALAGLLRFLVSESAGQVTGQAFVADAGETLR